MNASGITLFQKELKSFSCLPFSKGEAGWERNIKKIFKRRSPPVSPLEKGGLRGIYRPE
jgi:hypothetical protein